MSSETKRYDLDTRDCGGLDCRAWMDEASEGEWVRYADYEALTKALAPFAAAAEMMERLPGDWLILAYLRTRGRR